jgi:hypothetical protein
LFENNKLKQTTSYFGIMASVKLSDIITKYEDCATSGDFADWVEKLELVAKLQNIEQLQSFLPLFLSGSAFAVYKQLPKTDRDDYDKLKASLLLAFGVNSYAAYEQLQRRIYQDGETVDVYLSDIRRLVTLMGQSNPEPLLKCAFMAGLPVDISVQLKSVAAVETLDLNALVTRARMMLSARPNNVPCAAGAPKQRSGCFTCGGRGHIARDCPSPRTSKFNVGNQQKSRTCYTCGELGHLAKNCSGKRSEVVKSGNGQGGLSAPDTPPTQQ